MDEELEQDELPGMVPLGQRLKEARQAKGLTIEDIAAKTRVPKRHLESLEMGAWSRLPAPTYTMGFAKAFAGEVGLDRNEVADQLREEMGDYRHTIPEWEGLEPADPNRAFPGWLVWTALLALAAAIGYFVWTHERGLAGADEADIPSLNEQAPAEVIPANEVTLFANQPVTIRVMDGTTILIDRELAQGESFTVPASATAPILSTANPENLRITVGTGNAPAIGPAGIAVSAVSLLGPDLMRGPATDTATDTTVTSPPPSATPRQTPQRRPQRETDQPQPEPVQEQADPPVTASPATNEGGTI